MRSFCLLGQGEVFSAFLQEASDILAMPPSKGTDFGELTLLSSVQCWGYLRKT